jgi:hypothetical protein
MQHLVLYDSLQANSQKAQWDEGTTITADGKCQFEHGAYQLLAVPLGPGLVCYAEASRLLLTDFTYEANITLLNGNSAGLIFRSQAVYPIKEYRFTIHTDNTYGLFAINDDQMLTLWSGSSAFISRDQANILAVVVEKNLISLYVNHHFLAQIHDSTYIKGRIGFYTPESPTDENLLAASAKDVTVWSR